MPEGLEVVVVVALTRLMTRGRSSVSLVTSTMALVVPVILLWSTSEQWKVAEVAGLMKP